jgi:hypothetical protein
MHKTPRRTVVLACAVVLTACADPMGSSRPGKTPRVDGMIGSGFHGGDPPPDTAPLRRKLLPRPSARIPVRTAA